jgi:hypothetical protein
MKVVYCAGPYRSKDGPWGVRHNIDVATRVARELWLLGFAVICPHANTAWMDGPQPSTNKFGATCGPGDARFLEGDLEILKRCDGLVLVGEWWLSAGAKNEREVALGIMPVFAWPQDMVRLEEFGRETL